MADYMPIRCDIRDDGVAVLTLDNPPLNVVFRGLTVALGQALDALAVEPRVRAVVLAGAGRAFCAGSDIAEFQPLMQPGRIGPEKLELQHRVFARLADFPKPTVAAVHGVAFGGGLEIAVCCDFIVADPAARFALPEIKLGVFPGSGGPVRVTRRIGVTRAKEMMLLGEPIDAATALAWGLVNRVSQAGQAQAQALALAGALGARPPLAMSLCKTAIGYSWDDTEASAIARALPLSERAFTSAEAREGVRAFLAKETPRFPDALHDARQGHEHG
nr:enoyl-CoA hydratase-related protein [uncultured Achromobacter sp.]